MTKGDKAIHTAFLAAMPREHTWSVNVETGPEKVRIEAWTHTDPARRYITYGRGMKNACARAIRKIRGIGVTA